MGNYLLFGGNDVLFSGNHHHDHHYRICMSRYNVIISIKQRCTRVNHHCIKTPISTTFLLKWLTTKRLTILDNFRRTQLF